MNNGSLRQRLIKSESSASLQNEGDSGSTAESLLDAVIVEAPDWCLPDWSVESQNAVFSRFIHWGPISATLFTIMIGASVIFMHVQWSPLFTVCSMLELFLFLILTYSTLRNLCLAAFVGPGYVPSCWTPPCREDEARLQFCKICKGFKAPRSHHCVRCNRCVLKMDHHCPWINNCVGHRNHAFFVRFLASAVAGCIYAVIVVTISLHHAFYRGWYLRYGKGDEPIIVISLLSFILCTFATGIALGVIFAVGFLLVIQIKVILRNRTGIEDYIVEKARHRRSKPFHYPYNLGWRRNLTEVLGTWSGKTKGSGIWWPVRHPANQFTFSEEQLMQKKLKWESAIDYIIIKDFAGGFCKSIKLNFTVWACQPWTDEHRVTVKEGELWSVTRRRKHWLYGVRNTSKIFSRDDNGDDDQIPDDDLLEDRNTIPPRGWFPSICASEC